MTNIKPRQAWQMALSLFNGVVKSGYGLKTPFRCGVSECDSIKSGFPCGATCKHLFCDHLANQLTADSYHFADKHNCLDAGHTQWLRNDPFLTYGSCVVEPQTLLTLDCPSRWSAAGVVIITQQIGQFPHQLWSSRMEIWWAGKC